MRQNGRADLDGISKDIALPPKPQFGSAKELIKIGPQFDERAGRLQTLHGVKLVLDAVAFFGFIGGEVNEIYAKA